MNRLQKFWNALGEPPPGKETTMETISNFTPRAQQVLALGRKEADRLNHNFLGTEHVLLGLIKLGQGVAVNVLGRLGLDLETVRAEVEKQVGTGPEQTTVGNIPYTPRVKKVIALAQQEAKQLNHTYVGTEHLLLGLLREGDGVAAKVLQALGVDIERTRREILRELDPNFSTDETQTSKEPTTAPPTTETPAKAEPARPKPDSIDTSRRYDVYCAEQAGEIVVYRNASFKGVKKLYQMDQFDRAAHFLELEQADGQTIFIAKTAVIKFCEHGGTPNAEPVSGKRLD